MFDDDRLIFKKALGILKHAMSDDVASDQYPGPTDISETSSMVSFIPAILLELVNELINCSDEKQDDARTSAISIWECIIYGIKEVLPPLQGFFITLNPESSSRFSSSHGCRRLVCSL